MTRKIVFTVNLREVKRFSEYFSVCAGGRVKTSLYLLDSHVGIYRQLLCAFCVILTHFAQNTVRVKMENK